MKKSIKAVFILALCFISVFNMQAFASENNEIEVNDINLSQEEIDAILSKGNTYTATERASGLIQSGSIAINNDYKMLQLVSTLNCSSDVVKCGFEDIIVQRRASSSDSWSTYHQFDDDYVEASEHSIIKAVTTVTGYEYRVICTFYAKKSIFSVQRIDAESNIIAF